MATTTDTLIFELKVKDDASKVFDSWEKRLKDLEKVAETVGKNISANLTKGFDASAFKNFTDSFKKANDAAKSMFPTFSKLAGAAKVLWGSFTDVRTAISSIKSLTKSIATINVSLKAVAATAKAVMAVISAGFSALGGILLAPFKLVTDVIGGLVKFTKASFKKIAGYVVDFAKDATKNFLKWEKVLIVVSRTTGKTWEETKKLGSTLIDMALSVGKFVKGGALEKMGLQSGIAVEKLTEIAGIAGQLGIHGTESMVRFVNVVAKMGVATDLSATKAAELLATLGNLFNLNADGIERIASVINELGNTTVATQSQIGEMMRRMGGTAAFLGLSADKVAAFAATMREAGVSVRVGGTAMSQFMLKLMNDGERMAQGLGLNWESLKATLESNDPSPAIVKVLQAVNQLQASGGRITVAEKLQAIGITGIGLQDTILKLSQNTGLMTKNLKAAAVEWEKNTSLTNEYAKTLETAGHQFDRMWSFVDAIKKVVGEDLAQAFGNFTEQYLTPLVEKFLEWVRSEEVQKFLEETIPAALEWIGEKIELASGFFSEFFDMAKDVGIWEAFKSAVGSVWSGLKNIISDAWSSISSDVDGKISALKSDLKGIWDEMVGGAKTAWYEVKGTVLSALRNIGDTIGEIFGGEAQQAFADFTDLLASIPGIVEAVSTEIKALMPSIKEVVDGMVDLVNTVKDVADAAKTIGENGFLNTALHGVGGATKETDPELFAPLTDEMIRAAREAKGLENAMGGVNDAQKQVEEEGWKNSVWPDMRDQLNQTGETTKGLSQSVGGVTESMRQVDSVALKSLGSIKTMAAEAGRAAKAITTSYNAVGGFRMTESDFRDMTSARATTPTAPDIASPGRQTSGSISTAKTTTTKTTQTERGAGLATPSQTTIVFQGTNIVDESSKNRFARAVTNTQITQRGLSVRA